MSRRLALAVILGSLLLVILFVLFYGLRGEQGEGGGSALADLALPGARAAAELDQVTLYFPGQDGRLHPESRTIARVEEPPARAAEIVRALLRGPERLELRSPLPSGTKLLGLDLDPETRVLYLDLGGNELAAPLEGGSKVEMLTVYSLINSVVLNVAEVERVALLWNGQQGSTFAGHVAMTHPLKPDRSILARLTP